MTYVRFSTMAPATGRENEVSAINQELVQFYRSQPGCLGSHFIQAADASGEQGRVTFWYSENDADTAARQERSLFLRSQLHLLVRSGHQERSFWEAAGEPAPAGAGA